MNILSGLLSLMINSNQFFLFKKINFRINGKDIIIANKMILCKYEV